LKHTLLKIRLIRNLENTQEFTLTVSLLKIQYDSQEGRHPIYIYEFLREEKWMGRGIKNYKLLETK